MTNIFLSVFEISVSASLIVAVLILLTPFLNRRYAAKWKYWIWIFLALRLILPFSGTDIQAAADTLLQMKFKTTAEPEKSSTDIQLEQTAAPRRVIVEIPEQMTTPLASQSEKGSVRITPLDIAAVVWLMGGLLFLSVHLIPYLHYKSQIRKKGTYIKDAALLRQLSELKQELHINCIVHVVEYPEASGPMIIGFWKPVLILPTEQYQPKELFFILKHELVHLKRGDVYIKLLFMVANAVHWFNPFVWMMQKEAVVDMELSCDERVTQGTGYAVRKAYTETLLSTLHRQCTKGTVLSTQFYGGKQIMKKRFKNILIKKGKKNGVCILLCAVVLTVSTGTLIGCSVKEADDDTQLLEESGKDNADVSGDEAVSDNLVIPADDGNGEAEKTTTLTFYKEGEPEEKQATLTTGAGYSLYLPDGEWQQSGIDGWFQSDEEWHKFSSDAWTAVVNEQVRLCITHFEDASVNEIEGKLAENGYGVVDNDMMKQEGETVYKVKLHAFENDVWGVHYCYPVDAEEGWGRSLPVIADTFAVSVSAGDVQIRNSSREGSGAYPGAADRQEIRNIVDEFAAAYFDGDVNTIQKFLANTYEGNISTYQGTGTISDLTVKGLSDVDEQRAENVVSLEYRDSDNADTFRYLTFTFVRQEDDWKIQFYGMEG